MEDENFSTSLLSLERVFECLI